MVRKLVALYDGELHFDSTAGQGTTFTVRLPIYDA
jgi:signal transduction histidine kinase